MTLDNFRSQTIVWDKANRKVYENVRVSSEDENGRKLAVQIVNDGVVEDLTGFSLNLAWETRDKTTSGLDAFEVVDISKGQFSITYKTGMLQNVGNLNAQLVLVGTDTSKITSENFTITVFGGVGTDGAESSNEFSALTTALATVNQYDERIESKADKSTTEQSLLSLNQQVSETASRVTSLASGSPKGVFPTLSELKNTYPTGNNNIYVVSSDGKWYFWNEITWVAGGNFQAVGLDETFANETVKLLNVPIIENKIKNGNFTNLENWSSASGFGRPAELSVSKNVLTVKATTGVGSGVRTSQSLFTAGRTYYVRATSRVTNPDCNIMQLKQGDVDVFDTIVSPEMNKWYVMEGLLTITSDTHDFLHLMHQYSSADISSGKEMQVKKVIIIDVDESFGIGNNLKVWDISEKVDNIPNQFFNGKYSLFKADNLLNRVEEIEKEKEKNAILISEKDAKDVFTDKTVIHNTNIDYSTGNANPNVYFAATVFIPVEPNTDYVVDRNDFFYSNTGNIAFYDTGKKYISGIESTYEAFRTPTGCSLMRFSVYYNDVSSQQFDFKNMRVQKGTVLKPSDELASFTNIRPLSPLKNKKVVFLGDSLTEKNNRSSLNYHDYIKQELDITTFNMGVGGTGYKNRDNENKAFYHRALNVPLDADAIIIFGFINDALFMDIEIGNATDKTIATWCGCVNRTIDNLESKFLYVPLGIITPPPCDWVNVGESSFTSQRPDDLTCRVSLMTEKMSEICKLRGIPLLDLFHQSNLRPWIPAVRKELFSCGDSPEGDGLHLNSKGHKKIYIRVMKFTEGVLS